MAGAVVEAVADEEAAVASVRAVGALCLVGSEAPFGEASLQAGLGDGGVSDAVDAVDAVVAFDCDLT